MQVAMKCCFYGGRTVKCRGKQVREQIVKNYQVIPVAHIKLLVGQTKRSDAEADISNEYYIFEAIGSDGKKEIIQCGMGAARDFLNLLKHDGLPIFNPLHIDRSVRGHGSADSGLDGNENQGQNWNQTTRQLYNAIMWLIIAWDANPGTPLFKIRDEIIKDHNPEHINSKVKSVNTMIQRGGHGRTLTEIINSFRDKNNLRGDMCQFDLLIDVINNATDKEGNHIQSFF